MKKISVAFLWHFHQPYYKNPNTDEYIFPWVRFHTIKAYYDMGKILEELPNIKVNFNFTPSLLSQIIEYTTSNIKERTLYLTLTHPRNLTNDEKIEILENFFSCNFENMIKPYPEYLKLYEKKKYYEKDLPKNLLFFTQQEIFDLQVWFNLAWFGYCAQKEKTQIKNLIKKGKNFTEAEKREVVNLQFEIMKEVIPLYKRLQKNNQIEITTSPYYHPILPLLYNTDIAKRSQPHLSLCFNFSHPEDAKRQTKYAIKLHKDVFGITPQGMWPSEGSVAPEIVPLVSKEGIRWIATDEDILKLSTTKDKNIYISHKIDNISIIFRNKELSDKISFIYHRQNTKDAVFDFINELNKIKNTTRIKNPLVTIILDGENPWENYEESGYKFLSELYNKLLENPEFETVRVSDFLNKFPPQKEIKKLYSGSWINHNFSVWIGHKKDQDGWFILKNVRNFLDSYCKKKSLPPKIKNALWEKIYICEGSDWFWWWGDEFPTQYSEEFDLLFRENLSYIYKTLKVKIPEFLFREIKHLSKEHTLSRGLITPIIDGKITNFYEWSEAGVYQNKFNKASMIDKIFYGFDKNNLYFRVDFDKNILKEERIIFKLLLDIKKRFFIEFTSCANQFTLNEQLSTKKYSFKSICIDDIVELAIPLNKIKAEKNDEIKFYFELYKKNNLTDTSPYLGKICFKLNI